MIGLVPAIGGFSGAWAGAGPGMGGTNGMLPIIGGCTGWAGAGRKGG